MEGKSEAILCTPPLYLMAWKVCNFCMAFFFALAAFVQINDPDAGIWIVAYVIPATLSFLVGLNPPITVASIEELKMDHFAIRKRGPETQTGQDLTTKSAGESCSEESTAGQNTADVSSRASDNFIWKSLSELHMYMCSMVAILWAWRLQHGAKNNIFHEEEGRELLGLVIIVTWILLCRHSGKYLGGCRLSIAVLITVLPFITWLYYYINKELRASWPDHCRNTI